MKFHSSCRSSLDKSLQQVLPCQILRERVSADCIKCRNSPETRLQAVPVLLGNVQWTAIITLCCCMALILLILQPYTHHACQDSRRTRVSSQAQPLDHDTTHRWSSERLRSEQTRHGKLLQYQILCSLSLRWCGDSARRSEVLWTVAYLSKVSKQQRSHAISPSLMHIKAID